jgi:hypothetical protein
MQPPPTFNFGLALKFFFVYRILSMRQKTKNHQNQGSIDKKFDFFHQSPTHIPRWVHLVQKTRAKNSHAWAPLMYCVGYRSSKRLIQLICHNFTNLWGKNRIPESIGWIREDQPFSPSYDLAPPPAPTPSSPARKLDRRHTGGLRKRDNLLMGERGGCGGGARSLDIEKAWSSINHEIFSAAHKQYGGNG